MNRINPLGRAWKTRLVELVRDTRRELLLVSPYMTSVGLQSVASNLNDSLRGDGVIRILTDLSPEPICRGSTDPNAIFDLAASEVNLDVFHLSRVHAKVYVSDGSRAIVTSGNLTAGGLNANYEFGVEILDRELASEVRSEMLEYIALGAAVDRGRLKAYCEIADRVRTSFRDQLGKISKEARREFDQTLAKAEDELVSLTLAKGPMNAVFEKAILYLLKTDGPQETRSIHAFIKDLHPALCDDSVDRIIDGVRFGKKWKHAVRTAQQHLKKRGLVEFQDDGKWRLVPSVS